jgi:hypothetical protein
MAKRWPKKLIAVKLDDGTIIVSETPEDISEDFADEPIAVYELLAIGKFRLERHVDAKLVDHDRLVKKKKKR